MYPEHECSKFAFGLRMSEGCGSWFKSVGMLSILQRAQVTTRERKKKEEGMGFIFPPTWVIVLRLYLLT